MLVQPMAPRAAGGVTWVRALAVDLELAGGAFDRAVAGAARVTRAALSTLGPPWTEVPEDLPVGLSERRLRTGLWPHLRQAHALFDTGTLDMEWAYDGQGAFVLLQARPVGERHPARRLLTAANLREVTPPEPSPFLLGALEAVSLRLPRYYARLDRRVAAWREPFSVTVGSRAYINVDLYAALMDRWGLPRALVSRAIGGSVPGRPPRPDRLLASLPALARLAADWTRLHPGGVATLARLRSELEAAREPPELAAWFVDAFESLIQGMFGIASALSAAIPLWPGPAPAVATAAMAAELRSASDVGSAAAWTAFAEHWGHRGEYESDPAWPRGDEMLERVISEGVIEVNRQNHPLTHHPLPGYPRLHPRTPAPRPPLPDPLTALPRPLRRFPMLAPRHLRAHREWFKDGAMRLWAAFRARMLAAAAEQVRRGALEQPEQIWMLTPDEIQRLSPAQWRAAAGRRADARPDSVGADLFWSDTLSPLARAPGSRYTRRDDRLPLVTGMVSGPALVAHTPSEALALLATLPTSGALGADPGPRPILLAPAVDPGWLPVFLRVAGVATELGGRLSHAATLLRELRIPSVLNLSGVTQTARSGEPIVLRVPPGEVSRTPGA